MTFKKSLKVGLIGESDIARWLISRGNNVLPVYETEQEYKGPRIFTQSGELIATDMFVFNKNKSLWIEAKTKSAFTWHRISSQWTTGIDLHHYFDYLKVKELSDLPVYLLFLHRDKTAAKDSPMGCPTGLYGGEISYLKDRENHRHLGWGKHGMVYWAEGVLKKYASLDKL